MICPKCNINLPSDSAFCPNCGCNIEKTQKQIIAEQEKENKTQITERVVIRKNKTNKTNKILVALLVISIIACLSLGYCTFSLYNQIEENNNKIGDYLNENESLKSKNNILKKQYDEKIAPALMKQFNYSSPMQIPKLVKIVLNEGLGDATQDKKIIETAINELTTITGQKAVQTLTKKDISNFRVRKKMPIGARVTLRRDRMYEFMERFIRIALPRIRDFKGIAGKLDGRGNYSVGITEQIIFPEINIDNVTKMTGMNITFVTTAKTDEEGYALLKEFGLPFNNAK